MDSPKESRLQRNIRDLVSGANYDSELQITDLFTYEHRVIKLISLPNNYLGRAFLEKGPKK